MWNYSFTVPSLLILLTLLAFYFARRRLPIRLNRSFLRILLVHLYVVLFDFVSSMADEHYARFSPWSLYALNTMFFVFFVGRIYSFYRFSVDVLELQLKPREKYLLGLPFYIGEFVALSSFLTGAVFRIEADGYHQGPLYNVIYVCFFFYIFLSILLFVRYSRGRRASLLPSGIAFNLVLFVGNIVRMLLPTYLVMNTFCVIAILIIYLAYLNPDLYISGRGWAFNLRAFQAVLREMAPAKSFRILGFVLQNYNNERSILGGEQMDQGIARINQYLATTFPDMLPFYMRSGRYAVLGRDSAPWDDIQNQIHDRFQQSWVTDNAELYLSVAFARVDSDSKLASADRIVNNLVLALESVRDAQGQDAVPVNIQEIDQQVDILRSLEQALENDGVEVFLQPVVDSRTRAIVAAEALARIRDPEGKIIPPGMFIPIAEHSGHINKLGERVFEKTCRFIRDNDLSSMGLQWINVNLSPIQCLQRDLARRLAEILDRCHVSADKIHLEVTEQSMVDYSQLQKQIEALQACGFQFVLDDYGSGYSNLTRVKHYPFINIKLDMEVVWDFFRDRDSLLPNLVQGFKRMNLSITAEGIETPEMADVLTAVGSDFLQGYLFSKPLPIPEFVRKYGKRPEAAPSPGEHRQLK